MLCWITILGVVLIMMEQHTRSEALFYYFRLEDQVPETFLAFFLFTIHEEIGISADAALPIAGCTFPIVLLGSLIACLVKKVGGRSR